MCSTDPLDFVGHGGSGNLFPRSSVAWMSDGMGSLARQRSLSVAKGLRKPFQFEGWCDLSTVVTTGSNITVAIFVPKDLVSDLDGATCVAE